VLISKGLKPFLKWPGGKYRLRERILPALGQGNRLIEPFVGSAAVFLNSDYQHYLLADTNPDLIMLYNQLRKGKERFIDYAETLFTGEYNNEASYYCFRDEFNSCKNKRRRASLFIYLNRHCYNGLCRYNSKGLFNTPFGRYKRPRLPRKAMLHFIVAAENTSIECADYQDTMCKAEKGDVVYCDPPYVPLNATSYFTDYHVGGFNWDDQVLLVERAGELAGRGVRVVISNHDTKEIRKLYKSRNAKIESFDVQRNISCNADNRKKVKEILAIFS
jgi:DNA adenine methylase